MSNIRNILINCFEKCKTMTTEDILSKPIEIVGYPAFDESYFTNRRNKRSMAMFKYEIGTYKIGPKQIRRRKSK